MHVADSDLPDAAVEHISQTLTLVILGNALAVDNDHGSGADHRPSFAVM
jgi:hypothetical protein